MPSPGLPPIVRHRSAGSGLLARGFSRLVDAKGDLAGRHEVVVLVVREHLEVVDVPLFNGLAVDQLGSDRDGVLWENPACETGFETLDEPAVQVRGEQEARGHHRQHAMRDYAGEPDIFGVIVAQMYRVEVSGGLGVLFQLFPLERRQSPRLKLLANLDRKSVV